MKVPKIKVSRKTDYRLDMTIGIVMMINSALGWALDLPTVLSVILVVLGGVYFNMGVTKKETH